LIVSRLPVLDRRAVQCRPPAGALLPERDDDPHPAANVTVTAVVMSGASSRVDLMRGSYRFSKLDRTLTRCVC
jgi:hypothetical protein